MLDDLDRLILRTLQDEPKLGLPDLADRVRVTPSRASRKLERLRELGVLRGIRALVDWRALGYEIEVSLRFTLDKTQGNAFDEFMQAARAIPEVTEIQTFLGKIDVRLNVIACDIGHYRRLYRERILTLPHISDLEALMHVATVKEQDRLPI